ncbi:MAG: hypothetical protein ACRDRL_25985 [Sciscionella sp.]
MSSAVELNAPGPRGVSPLVARLIDDASLYPPGNADMQDAISAHLRTRATEHAGVLGVFLCPASRLAEMITALSSVKPDRPIGLSLVIDTGMGGVPKAVSIVESRTELLALRMIEMPAPADVDEVWLERVNEFVPEDVTRVVEPRRGDPRWLDGVRKVTEFGCVPKLRCGGARKQNFPSVEEVADFLAVVSQTGTSFKATAGLYQAVRRFHTDIGVDHHGFLNLLVATARALAGKNVREALRSTERAALAAEAAELSEAAARAVRGIFSSYGACELDEPVTELRDLGLL